MAGYTKNADGGYSVNYEDERFQDVKNEQTQKETELNNNYDNIINNSDKYYQNQIDAAKDYADKQSELQQSQTDFAIEQINQQKEQSQKDYTKEQKASYVDYMKQTKSNAQNMANGGLSNTGFSESSIVSMYNQYQNRVGTAKESLNQAILNYNNSIQQATLANNEKLAEIAYNALQTQNQLNQQAFEYKNAMLLQKESALQELNNTYYARYQDVLSQINNEIDLQMRLDEIDREYDQWLKEFNLKTQEFDLRIQERKDRLAQSEREYKQWEREIALKEKETNASIANIHAQTEYHKAQAEALKNEKRNPFGDNPNYQKLHKNLSNAGVKTDLDKSIFRNLIYGEVQNGHINDKEASALFDEFKL